MVRAFGPEDLSSTRETVVEVVVHASADLRARARPRQPGARTTLWPGRTSPAQRFVEAPTLPAAAHEPPPREPAASEPAAREPPPRRPSMPSMPMEQEEQETLESGLLTLKTGGLVARLQRAMDEEVTLEGDD
jgi:hypothetical protein